jgi:hypothetical protein
MSKLLNLFLFGSLIAAVVTISSCKEEETNPEEVRLQSGYVVVGVTDDDSYLVRYFDELPSGTVDITQGTAFQSFFPLSVRDGALFMTRTDGSAGFAKISVDGNQQFVEDGIISTISNESFSLRVRDSQFGVFHDRNDPDVINTFNPTTMEVTGTIDMSGANDLIDDPVRYQTYIFRGANEIFVPTRLEAGGNLPNVQLPKVSISSGEVNAVAELENAGDLIVLNRFGQRYTDEMGNLYFYHAGNISLPTVSGAILKIPAGSDDYDPNYNFKVPEVNNPEVIGFGSFLSAFYYYKNNIGFALVNESLDPRIVELITQRGGIQNLTDTDFEMIQFWLFTTPTAAWVQLDMVNQTVTKITDLPALSAFDNAGMAFIDGIPHISISNPSVNGLYRVNTETSAASEVFTMNGASLLSVFDLSSNE